MGCICLALGALGTILPLLPTVPFLVGAALCFAKGSDKLHRWFTDTRLYQENLADYAAGWGMTRAAKRHIMLSVTALMAFGLVIMLQKGLYVPSLILAAVWLSHVLYFCFAVKTIGRAYEQ